jgi:serine/threonine protein kinase
MSCSSSSCSDADLVGGAFTTPVTSPESPREEDGSSKASFDDFTVVRPINRGAHSLVHLVLHREQQRYFALKVLSKERLARAGPSAARSVLREKRALLAVQPHPFIAALDATFQDESRLFLLLELGLGGDLRGVLLRQRRRRRGPAPEERLRGALDEPAASFYCGALVLALDHLHGRGFAYRDLKPENVLLRDNGQPMLCDLGSAVHVGATGRALTHLGTWEYAAPEQLAARGCTLAADWWALGVLTLEALCGETPFPSGEADDAAAVLAHVSAFTPASPLLLGLSSAAAHLLLRHLLVRDESARWAACAPSERMLRTLPFFVPRAAPPTSADSPPPDAPLADTTPPDTSSPPPETPPVDASPVDATCPATLTSSSTTTSSGACASASWWGELGAGRVPPPHLPSLLGAADTRNFWHANLDEPDAVAVGVGLTGRAPPPPTGGEGAGHAPVGEAQLDAEHAAKRARRDAHAPADDWWAGF